MSFDACRLRFFFALLGLTLTQAPAGSKAASAIYTTDFEGGAGSEWSVTTTDNSIPGTFTRFLGRYNNAGSTLTLTGLTPGAGLRVFFDFYLLDSWDGGSLPGGDKFQVVADGVTVFDHTFSQFNGAQTFTDIPDTKGQLGFGGWEDSIFRTLEVAFVPAAATATLTFQGGNLQAISDESWGIDNVEVWLASETPATFVSATSLPASGSPVAQAIDRFTLTFSRTLQFTSATNAVNYELRHAGSGGVFGDANDTVYSLTPSYTAGTKTVSFVATPNPLPTGKWRFRATTGVRDAADGAIALFERIFDLADPTGGKIEALDNDTLPVAVALPMVETPAGRNFYTGYGLGTFAVVGDVDYWRIDAEAGDRITVELEATDRTGVYPRLQIRNAADSSLVSVQGGVNDGLARIQNFVAPAPGTYYLRVWTDNAISTYRLRVDQSRGIQLENEGNNTQGAATLLSLTAAGGILEGNLAANMGTGDTAGDFISLGRLNAGNAITASLAVPIGANVATNGFTMDLQLEGSGTAITTDSTGLLNHTVAADGVYYLVVNTATRSLRSQYLAKVSITDIVPPVVTSVSFPEAGASTHGLIYSLTVRFSEPLQAAAATNVANYSLLEAGGDATFGNANDNVYVLEPLTYAGGLDVSFRIVNSPLQPGSYRFRVSGNVLDRVGLNLNPEFERLFTVEGIDPFVSENNRNNDTPAAATVLGALGTGTGTLWLGGRPGLGGGTSPYDVTTGDFNGDGVPDLATANASTDDISIFLGVGDGTFLAAVRYPSGDHPISIAAGDLNHDGKIDLAVAHYNAATVGVHLGNGDGTFAAVATTAVGSNPRNVRLAMLDADDFPEILVANGSQNYLTVLKRNGSAYDRTDRTAANGVWGVASGDVNGDGKIDVVTANGGSANLTVFTNDASGLLVSAGNLSAGNTPRDLALVDLNNDGKLDIAVLNAGSQTVGVYLGNGDATFATAVTYADAGSDSYHIVAANFAGDARPDLAVAGYGSDRLIRYVNNGDGTFAAAVQGTGGGNPIGVISGDWNGDGYTDLATANYHGQTVGIWLQDRVQTVPEDPTGMFTTQARGSLSSTSDYDYYSFFGQAGDILSIATEVPGSPGASQLYYWVGRPDGGQLTDFYANSYYGWGQSTPVTLPATGTYVVYARYNYEYFGEYRIRVTLVRNGIQMEYESGNNDSPGAADYPSLPLASGKRAGTIAGYIGVGDSNGDYYGLGNLAEGTTITLSLAKPATSPLTAILEIYRGSTLVTNSAPGDATLAYPVGAGENALFYARVRASAGAGLLAQYLLGIELLDAAPPTITAVDLPADGTTSTNLVHRFAVSFSEDMLSSTVTNLANYTLIGLGADLAPGGGDDTTYDLISEGYGSGLITSFRIANGPLQPGAYRLTIATGLTDAGGQSLASPYVRGFTIQGVPLFAFENNHSNHLPVAATPLGGLGAFNGGLFFGVNYGSGGANPYDIATGDFDEDGIADLVTGNANGDDISIFRGLGDGTFQSPVRIPSGDHPISVAVGDLNHDGHLDVVVAHYSAATVGVHLGNGDGTFAAVTTTAVGNQPRNVRLAQLDGDLLPEILVAHGAQNYISILKRNGATYDRTDRTTANNPWGVASGDFNGDGLIDVVTANAGAATITILTNGPAGTLTVASSLAAGSSPRDLAVADFDGDNIPDIAVLNGSSGNFGVYRGNGDGTFAAVVTYPGIGSDPYHIHAADFTGDGRPDILVAVYGSNQFDRFANNGDGTFGTVIHSGAGGNPIGITSGDWNGDGRVDFATANYGGSTITIWLGDRARPLTQDPPGLWTGQGRGSLYGTADEDVFSFGALAGDILGVGVETVGSPGASQLYYRVYNPSGAEIQSFYANSYNGWGQSTPLTLPVDGTYTLRVSYNYDYREEYRIRTSLARGGLQMESEPNDNLGAADVVSLTLASGKQIGFVTGYIGVGDGSGDYYALGNLTEATQIRLSLSQPASSSLSAVMEIYRADGTKVAFSTAGDAELVYLVPAGANASYSARVVASAGAGLMSQYVLAIELADTVPPTITALSLPSEGGTSLGVWDRFTLSFSEDMMASTVTNAANYELRWSSNATFGDGDDVLYSILPGAYGSGLNASFLLPDGPLQPGSYRFTASVNLIDRGGTALENPYFRLFTVGQIPGQLLESRNNNSQFTATPVGGSVGSASDGSFGFVGTYGTGSNPYDILRVDLNGDGVLDLVTANLSSDNITVFLGVGNGTFAPGVSYAVGNGPIAVAAGDFNGDGKIDVAAANYHASSASMLLGDGTGVLGAPVTRAVGSNPRDIAAVDLNADGKAEILVANSGNNHFSVLTFQEGTPPTYARVDQVAANNVWGVATGDVNGDGKADVITSNLGTDGISVLLGDGLGGLGTPAHFAVGNDPRHLVPGDFDGDGKVDVVTVNTSSSDLSFLKGNGDGTFATALSTPGVTSDPYHLAAGDFDGDGTLDVAVAVYSSSDLQIFYNQGSGVFDGGLQTYQVGSNPIGIAAGDFNGDGLADVATADYGGSRISVWLQNRVKPLVESPTGVLTGVVRGNLSSTSDVDYWSFSAQAGDVIVIASEVPGYPGSSGLYYRVERPDGAVIGDFYGDPSGWGASDPFTAPLDGTYYLRVSYNYQYFGEYRARITLQRNGIQAESENNDNVGQADPLSLTLDSGQRRGSIVGYMDAQDTSSGDFFALGNLTAGTTVNLSLRKPGGSPVSGVLGLYNSGGNLIAGGAGTALGPVSHTLAEGTDGPHFARVTANYPARPGGTGPHVVFRSSSDYIEVPLDVPETTMTVAFWFYSVSGNAGLFEVSGNGHDRHLYLSGGNIYARLWSNQVINSSGLNLADGRWHHVAYEFGASISGQRIYIDGVLRASGNKSQSDFTSQTRVLFGYSSDMGGMVGSIDDASIWDSALSEAAIAGLMSASPVGDEAGLIGFWSFSDGTGTAAVNSKSGGVNGILRGNARWETFGPSDSALYGLLTQYVLDVGLVDTIPPVIAAISLPAAGTTSQGIIDRFTITFSEDMLASTVVDPGSYDLRAAGSNGSFGDGDDVVYPVSPAAYTSGLTASYAIPTAPLQPGNYQFTAKSSLQDRAANPLSADVVRLFTIASPTGFVMENRDNGSQATATPLSPTVGPAFDGSFGALSTFSSGTNPYGIQSADLDGDTNADLVVANYASNNIQVFLGNGDGSFRTPVAYAMGSNPSDLLLADFNGDGKLDAVTPNYGSGNASFRPGNGDGTFGTLLNLTVSSNPNGVAAGDIDKDGKLDLVVGNRGGNQVSFLKGNGDGTFAAAVAIATGSSTGPTRLTVADLNGDGHPDVAVALYNGGALGILLGDGTGALALQPTIAIGSGPYSVQAVDLNGDSILDLAVACISDHRVSVLLGTGGGAFAARADYPAGGNQPYHVRAADLNGDGRPDLLTSNFGSDSLGVLYNTGAGTFLPSQAYAFGNGTIASVVGDWNGDGRPDIAAANHYASTVSVRLGNPTLELLTDLSGGHGVRSASGHGNLRDTSDADYWAFTGRGGDRMVLGFDVPGRPGSSSLRYRVLGPTGATVADAYSNNNGWGQTSVVTLPVDGTYAVLVTYNNNFQSEYRIRVVLAPADVSQDNEDNGGTGSATPMVLVTAGDTTTGNAVGYIRTAGDLDYFDLGTIGSGMTVFLNARLLDGSSLTPVVSVYDASNGYVVEAPGGRAFDAVGEIRITTAGRYFAVVRGGAGEGGLREGYVLETQIVPTSSVAFPNLQVVDLLPPSGGGLLSGGPASVSFTVRNVGALATGGASWNDRLVLSVNATYGDADDLQLAVFPHTGALDPLGEYTVTQNVTLPDGIEGTFRLFAHTDSGNAIAEFVLEGDNVTLADDTLLISRADYPDLRPEGVSAVPGASTVAIDWNTANRGTKIAPAGFKDAAAIRNVGSGAIEYRVERTVANPLAIDGVLAGSASAPLPGPGRYAVDITVDSNGNVFEYDNTSHASAEANNLASVFFDVFFDLQVANARIEPVTGDLSSGQSITVRWEDVATGNRSVSASWSDRVLIVNRTSGETLLNTTVAHDSGALGGLAPGESHARERTFTLPAVGRGVGIIDVTITVDSAGQIAEHNAAGNAESNNSTLVTRTSVLAPYPDLQVTAFELPANADAGQPAEVHWTVENTGNQPATGSWVDSLYLSPEASGASPVFLGSAPFSGSVTNGTPLQRSATFTIPASAGGNRYLLVTTDSGAAVPELNDLNNTAVSDLPMFVRRPNLVVKSLTVPTTASSGQAIPVTWVVENTGVGTAFGNWQDGFHVSLSADGSNPVFLGQLLHTGPLAPGATSTNSGTVSLPGGLPGDRYIIATADVNGAVPESDETDNRRVADAPVLLSAPDLLVFAPSAPAAALFGETITVTYALTNAGNASAAGAWSDRILLSADAVAGGDTVLLTRPIGTASPIAAGATAPLTAQVTLPAAGLPGTYHLFVEADAGHDVGEAGEANNLSAPIPIVLSVPPRPDLVVEGVAGPGSAAPGSTIQVTWSVRNLGAAPASGSWRDSVYLATGALLGGDLHLGTFAFTETVAGGAATARSAQVVIPPTVPAGDLRLVVATDTALDVLESAEDNNRATSAATVNIPLTLTLSRTTSAIREGGSLGITVSRSGDRTAPLTINLSSSDTTEITAPASVVIAAGQAGAPFTLQAVNDGIVDGTQTVTLTAQAGGVSSASGTFEVTDAQIPALTVRTASGASTVTEGSTLAMVVELPIALGEELVVTLGTSQPGQLVPPAPVTIPAGQRSASFLVAAVDDTLIEGSKAYRLTATAAGVDPGQITVEVTDNDIPSITLTLAAPSVSESAGPVAVSATLTRNPASGQQLVVRLDVDAPGLTLPQNVTIPAFQGEAAFSIGTVNNNASDGDRVVNIQARVLESNGTAVLGNAAPVPLTITDDDGPTLTLTLSRSLVGEGVDPAATATVSRNTDTASELVVAVVSSEVLELSVPTEVVIPAGAASTTFPVTSLNDGVTDGNKLVTVFAVANGFTHGTAQITVSDANLPDLVLTKAEGPETADTEAYVSATYRIINQGSEPAGTNFSTRVFLSSDPVAGNDDDRLVGNYLFRGTIPPGLYFEQSVSIRVPAEPGNYWVIAVTDAGNQITETLEDNNLLVSARPIQVRPAYTATVSTAVETALAGTEISMVGRAVRQNGQPALEGSLVNIHITVNGTRRIISALVDRLGNFTATWKPLLTEAGAYEIGAAHPGEKEAPVQDRFVLLGMKIEPTLHVFHVPEGGTYSNTLRIINLSPQPLSGLRVTIAGQPSNVSVDVDLESTDLPGNGVTLLRYRVNSVLGDLSSVVGSIPVYVSSTEGAFWGAFLGVVIDPLRPHLVVDRSPLVASMLRGATRVVECTVTNDGGFASDALTVSVPPVPWLRVSSPNPIAGLAPGETTRVTLLLTPPADLPLGPYTGTISIGNPQNWVNVPFNFRAVSESKGDLRIEAVDEFTYYAEGSPKVADASVVVRDPFTHDVVAQGKTGADGVLVVPGLFEGHYDIEMTAPKHTVYRNTVFVNAGTQTELIAFFSRETVRYTWTVVPVEIEDHYKITIETEFETVVPVPVITIEPAVIDLSKLTAEETQVDLKITNHGLIRAQEFMLNFPTHPSWVFTPLVSDLGFLDAKSSITVPLTIRKIRPGGPALAGRGASLASGGGGACHTAGNATWSVPCGPFNPSYSSAISLANAASGCGGGSGGGGGGGYPISPGGGFGGGGTRGGGGGGGGGFFGPSVGGGVPCGPSASQRSLAALYPRPANVSERTLQAGEDGICARIKMRLEQEAVITRDAFQATLEIENNDLSDLTEVGVTVRAQDANGRDVSDLFGIRLPTVTGMGAADGTGVVPSGGTGTARWLIIPTVDAAPTEPVVFYVAGEFSYVLSGVRVRIPLEPVRITVLPTPRLWVKYFHQRDVYSDDPFTDKIEPSIPFSLAVMAENRGFGSTRSMKITSAQPQIIENEKGLLIDFKIIGTEVAGRNITPSLTVDLGDIGPGQSVVGRWLLTSTLQGLFTDYKASFEHIDGLGNPRLSLIEDLSIHEMIHIVYADGPFEDFKPDFFVNQVPDPLDLGDTLYQSNGQTNPVERVDTASVLGTVAPGNLSVVVTASMPAEWGYLRIPDPGRGEHYLVKVVRSDGVEIRAGVNFWTTDRTFIGRSKRPIVENMLHLLDYASTGAYTLFYDSAPPEDTTPPTSTVNPLAASSPATFPVTWSGSDNPGGTGIAYYDVFVSEDGGSPTLWLGRTDTRGALFTGTTGRRYSFLTRATDFSGNREALALVPTASTLAGLTSTGPVIGPIDAQTTDGDVPILGVPFTVTDPDTAPAGLTFTLESSNSTLLPTDRVTLNAGAAGYTLDLNPVPFRSGTADITVIVSDGADADRRTFTVTVRPVNHAPTPGFDFVRRRPGGSAKVLISQLLANDTDPELDAVQFVSIYPTSGDGGTITRSGQWILYSPPAGGGDDSDWFGYTVSDAKGATAIGLVVVTTDEDGIQPRNTLGITVADGAVRIEFVGIPGRRYYVQAFSSSVSPTWVTIGTVVADRLGVVRFVEETPPADARFYRTLDAGN